MLRRLFNLGGIQICERCLRMKENLFILISHLDNVSFSFCQGIQKVDISAFVRDARFGKLGTEVGRGSRQTRGPRLFLSVLFCCGLLEFLLQLLQVL